jgi:uncharacterized repeat protein (TIGR03803 family)
MKRCVKVILKQTIVQMSAFLLATAGNLGAEGFTNLYTFNGTNGSIPYSVIVSGTVLYGTTAGGGSNNAGTVFRINTDGTCFAHLHHFNADDGDAPTAHLILSGNRLYGTTDGGGDDGGNGTVFAVNTDGSSFTNLMIFSNTNGSVAADLSSSENVLYGMTLSGGAGGYGVIYRIKMDGSTFTVLHNFTNDYAKLPYQPSGILCGSNMLYGATAHGGANGQGIIFAMNMDGSSFTNLHDFSQGGYDAAYNFTNNDGCGLIRFASAGNFLFASASGGGRGGQGTIIRMNRDGTGFTNIYNFSAPIYSTGLAQFTNQDGCSPMGLAVCGNVFYGMANYGGVLGGGTLFKINADGTGFTTLYDFNIEDGCSPFSGPVLTGNTLYGTLPDVINGGSFGTQDGSIFALTLPSPSLNFKWDNSAIVLTWENPAFMLQFLPDAAGSFKNVSGASSPYTNTFTGSQCFFRLKME